MAVDERTETDCEVTVERESDTVIGDDLVEFFVRTWTTEWELDDRP